MIFLTKFSGENVLINPDMIKSVERGGDTILTLTTGEKVLVKESPQEIQQRFLEYKRVCSGAMALAVSEELTTSSN